MYQIRPLPSLRWADMKGRNNRKLGCMVKKQLIKRTVCLLAAAALSIGIAGCSSDVQVEESSLSPSAKELPELIINPLTGCSGFSEAAVGKRPVSVMVSNIQKSLPQWGISSADLIYEAVTEGGITRLMCVFADPDNVPNVGPVRSVREYYPQFSMPLNTIFFHFGGSTTGYDAVKEYQTETVDGMTMTSSFAQDTSRLNRGKEHTYYTNSELMQAGIAKKGYSVTGATPSPFSFTAPNRTANLTGGDAISAKVRFSGYITASFDYDPASGKYLRSQYGEPHIDANNGQQAAVTNVFIIYSPTSQIDGGILTRYDLTGGTGIYLCGGKQQAFQWTKGAYNEPFRFTDESGAELKVTPGNSWICVVPASQAGATVIEGAPQEP